MMHVVSVFLYWRGFIPNVGQVAHSNDIGISIQYSYLDVHFGVILSIMGASPRIYMNSYLISLPPRCARGGLNA